MHISNVLQLDSGDASALFLAVVCVHENEATGCSLPSLIDQLRADLTASAVDLLNEGLIEVGYLDAQRPLYDRTLYHINEVIYFNVRDDFPRLLRGAVPDGVKALKYQISIDSCKPYRVEVDSVAHLIRNLEQAEE